MHCPVVIFDNACQESRRSGVTARCATAQPPAPSFCDDNNLLAHLRSGFLPQLDVLLWGEEIQSGRSQRFTRLPPGTQDQNARGRQQQTKKSLVMHTQVTVIPPPNTFLE